MVGQFQRNPFSSASVIPGAAFGVGVLLPLFQRRLADASLLRLEPRAPNDGIPGGPQQGNECGRRKLRLALAEGQSSVPLGKGDPRGS